MLSITFAHDSTTTQSIIIETMNFQEKLKSLVERIEGNMPKDYLKIMHGATRDLKASGIQLKVLKVGDQMPEFSLKNQDGTEITLTECLLKGPLVLTFYRGFWCPYCNEDLAHLNHYVDEIRSLGAELVAISPELADYSKKIRATKKLTFDILHDPSNEIAARVGLKWYMVDPLKSLYRDKFNINFDVYHGDNEWSLPMPARILVGQDGIIKYIEFNPDYRKRPDPDEVVEALKKLAVNSD